MAWLGRLAVSPPHTHTRAATSRVTKNGIPALRRVTRTWGGGVNIAKCQFSFRILASKYFVKITDSSKRVVSPVRPTIAWAGRAWLMLDLLNKRAARRRLGPAARCPPGLAWGLSSNKYNNWIFSKIRIYFRQITICIQRPYCSLVCGQLHSWSCLICAELTALELLPVQVQSESGPSEGGWGREGGGGVRGEGEGGNCKITEAATCFTTPSSFLTWFKTNSHSQNIYLYFSIIGWGWYNNNYTIFISTVA